MSSISVILLTNGQNPQRMDGRTDGQTNGRDFNTSLAEVIKKVYKFDMYICKKSRKKVKANQKPHA